MHVAIAGLDALSAGPVSSARDLSHQRSVLDHAVDHHELTRLHVRADPDCQLSQTRETLSLVHRHLGYWCGGEELNLHVLADTSS